MKKLFLVSSFMDVADLLPKFERQLNGKTVTFIPTASKAEEIVFYVDKGRQALERMGLIVEDLELSTASPQTISVALKRNDYIYVTGGNTFYLLQEMKRTGADKLVIEEVQSGKLYIGESAGAIITAPTIDYAQEMDDKSKAPHLESFDALGLVDFCIVPHHTNPPFAEAAQTILDRYGATLSLVPISNQQAVEVRNDDYIVTP
ncbi:hypothetical protein PA598K_01302 [Paenibacillus sp. 598K]|uniref:peptidase E n=1 Tax=Paenibacillus sp. 598K TaxID=1117987 RepID=UPI000FFA0CAF|nr:Type 1 glutamine amidotransferase-like domain-containing protein [Paenibacillus sp. 598K]GBF73020.1 hypothetical protein PA598K_01302 [Paenibacillus sp. 598K]